MVKYLLSRVVGWLVLIFVAVNGLWLMAASLFDPRPILLKTARAADPERIDAILAETHLDPQSPLGERWWYWLTNVVTRFDWGVSPSQISVNEQLGYRVGMSAQLLLIAAVLSVIVGIALGVFAAARRYSLTDRVLQSVSIITMNLHTVVAASLVVGLGIALNQASGSRIFFVAGSRSEGVAPGWPEFVDRIQHVTLPALSLVLVGYATYHFTQRTMLLDTLNADFMRTARAKGLTQKQAIMRHALRTSLIPLTTSVAFAAPAMFTGSMLTEKIFAWRGVGDFFITAITSHDVNGVVAVSAFGALLTAMGALLSDVAVVLLDPRIRMRS